SVAKQLEDAGVEIAMPLPLDTHRPVFGLSHREVAKRASDLAWELPIQRQALARGDITKVSEILDRVLHVFHFNVNRDSPAYREAGLAVLRAHVRALEHLERRSQGEPIETPSLPPLPTDAQP